MKVPVSASQAHDDIDPADGGARGSLRHINDGDVFHDIFQTAIVFIEKVMMIGRVGIEIGTPGIHHDLAQQPNRGELMQGVVDGGKRDTNPGI
ncbi:MAG: hypothetical protein FD149_809 [Rhodospirillaceae bacterium]|nr:MAG: hypothetical protein FD149_809 [Rhodospirillaceae bacterium]